MYVWQGSPQLEPQAHWQQGAGNGSLPLKTQSALPVMAPHTAAPRPIWLRPAGDSDVGEAQDVAPRAQPESFWQTLWQIGRHGQLKLTPLERWVMLVVLLLLRGLAIFCGW